MTDSAVAEKDMQTDGMSQQLWGLVLTRFLLFFILLMSVVLSVSLPVYVQYKEGLQKQLLANEEISIVSAVQMFQKEMYEQIHMLHFITQTQA